MRWPEDLEGWPLREHSRRVLCRPHLWHVQEAGTGPTLVLIHGAGGATQSWRALFPLLARRYHVVAMDLPGQGFTRLGARSRCGLAPMAEDLGALIAQEGWKPAALVGHSAGAAIALRLAEDLRCPVLALNPALQNFDGVAGWLFPILARVLSLNPLSAPLFAASATPAKVRRLVERTGTHLPPAGLALYHRLATDRTHVDATLAMMAQWSLDGLLARLPRLEIPLRILVGGDDRAVPPDSAGRACTAMPDCRIERWEGLGHLIHEEAPDRVAAWIAAQPGAALGTAPDPPTPDAPALS
ncbi:MAG: magnesium chelatase accessory protein BchO [Rhodobacteraceae bacterium HLUCCA08]|nr:MAG: magnesium chelatase accessory protein BchO [Rhodobacteraceae bacterium HLUCCA08]